MRSIGARIQKIDPRLPVLSVASLADQQHNSPTVLFTGVVARLAVMFGAMALFLAGLGLYAVKSHMVASRTPEIGIRMALGATRRDILTLVLCQGATSTFVGLLIGTLLAFVMTRVIRSALQGIGTIDLVSIVVTVGVLTATSLLATYIPARRAQSRPENGPAVRIGEDQGQPCGKAGALEVVPLAVGIRLAGGRGQSPIVDRKNR